MLDELTLVGGCTAGLLITDPGSARVRSTLDVDLVVEAATYVKYEAFGRRLEARGFRRSNRPGDPLCRWLVDSFVLDVMPLDERVLGFSNRWYTSALASRVPRRLPSGSVLHHVDAPHFVATKLEAFASRGEKDFVASHDLEDVVLVIDGRVEIESEMATSTPELRAFVARELRPCLADRFFTEALPEYYPDRLEGRARARIVLDRMGSMCR